MDARAGAQPEAAETEVAKKEVIVDKDISCYAEIEKAESGYQVKIVKIEKKAEVEVGGCHIAHNDVGLFKITKDYSIYYPARMDDESVHLFRVRGGQQLLDFPIHHRIADFFISPDQGLIAFLTPGFSPKIRIFSYSGVHIKDFDASGISFISEEEWYLQTLQGILRVTYRFQQFAELLILKERATHFDVDPTGRLIATFNANVLFSPVDIHDTISKKRYSKVVHGKMLGMRFLSNKRVLIATAGSIMGAELSVYDFEQRKVVYKRKLSESEQAFVSKDKLFVYNESEREVIWFADFVEAQYQWQVVNHDKKKITITGRELLGLAYDAIKGMLNNLAPKNLQAGGAYVLQESTDWLHTAGHLSTYPTKFDRRSDFWPTERGVHFQVTKRGPKVEIRKTNSGDGFVVFHGGHDYRSIKDELRALTDEPPMTTDDVIKMIDSNFSWRPPANEKHQKFAKILLRRMAAEDYPEEVEERTRKFLDCLLMLMIGVESSRNNVTFLTSIMLFDLIEAGVRFAGTGRSYGFDSAFVSGLMLAWNDFESKDAGGIFPMAANSAGSGNFKDRASFIEGAIPFETMLQDQQKNKIVLSEIELIRDWLNALFEQSPEFFQSCEDAAALKEKIKERFLGRLQVAYQRTDRPCGFLPQAVYPYYSVSPRMQQHYEREKSFYYLSHQGVKDDPKLKDNPKLKKLDSYYHRVDVPCETLPGYVVRGDSKQLTLSKMTVRAEVVVKDKIPNKLVRQNLTYDELKLEIPKRNVSDRFKQQCLALLLDYNKWLLTYYQGDFIKKSLRVPLMQVGHDSHSPLRLEVYKRLTWVLSTEENKSEIAADRVKNIIRGIMSSEETIPFFLRDSVGLYSPDSLGKMLTELRDIIDPQMDPQQMQPWAEVSSTESPDELKQEKLRELAHRHAIFSDGTQPWFEFLMELQTQRWVFSYKLGFSFTKVEGHDLNPCPSCHSQAVDFPVLPYPHRNVLALSSERSVFFHRFDSDCSAVVRHEKQYYIQEQEQEETRERAAIAFSLKFERAGKKPCECCWIVPKPTLAPSLGDHHATHFSPSSPQERKRSRSPSAADREDRKRVRGEERAPRPPL